MSIAHTGEFSAWVGEENTKAPDLSAAIEFITETAKPNAEDLPE